MLSLALTLGLVQRRIARLPRSLGVMLGRFGSGESGLALRRFGGGENILGWNQDCWQWMLPLSPMMAMRVRKNASVGLGLAISIQRRMMLRSLW